MVRHKNLDRWDKLDHNLETSLRVGRSRALLEHCCGLIVIIIERFVEDTCFEDAQIYKPLPLDLVLTPSSSEGKITMSIRRNRFYNGTASRLPGSPATRVQQLSLVL